MAIGRIGCFLVGDDWGRPTDLPWGIAFPRGTPPTTVASIERSFGTFARSLTLPEGVDADGVTAEFERGVLEVRVPKPEARKPRRIEIWFVEHEGKHYIVAEMRELTASTNVPVIALAEGASPGDTAAVASAGVATVGQGDELG